MALLLGSFAFGADYSVQPASTTRTTPRPGLAAPQHAYVFGEPAYWSATLHWRYNGAGAPAALGANRAATIQQIVDASAKWTAACGVQIVYDGETASAPAALDRANVIGWRAPPDGYMAGTSDWTDVDGSGDTVIVDADIALSPTTVTTPQQLASVITHEWGHAIGLGHSPVADTLMAGPPDSAYSSLSDLTPDDVQGCRCLYGPPAGVQAGFLCSLPSKIDFGTVPVGTTGAARQINVHNDGSAALTINSVQAVPRDFVGSGEFAIANNHCAAGSTLAPGATCTFDLAAAPAAAEMRRAMAIIDTSVGPYRIPLSAEGGPAGAGSTSPPSALNFEGSWWSAPAGSESGWGLTLAHQDDVIFATWFTYDANGKAMWLTMSALRSGGNTYAGTLIRTTGPPLNSSPFTPDAVQRATVGNATLTFTDAGSGTFAYTVNGITQSKPITRMLFGAQPTCTFGGSTNPALATNFQGNWWTAGGGESGWGMYFTHQGDTIFASWFAYDLDGTPLWLTATASRAGNGVYRGDVIRTSGPAFSSVPFDSQRVTRSQIGSLTLTFSDGNNVAFASTVTLGSPQVTVTQFKQLTRLVFRNPGTICQ